MKFSDTIRPYKSADLTGFVRIMIDNQPIGWTRRDFAVELDGFNETWQFYDHALHLGSHLTDYDARSKAIDDTFTAMSAQGILPMMPDYSALGCIDWFPIRDQAGKHLAIVKRFYAPYLGIHFDNVMIHGFYNDRYWAAKRGKIVEGSPGMMDIMVAGAVCYDQSLEDAILAEGHAEAGISQELLPHIQHAQTLELAYLNASGFLMHETYYIYDLDTKGDFTPQTNLPLEVEGFQEYSINDVMIAIQHGKIFKGQINLVLTDFLIRHGHLNQDHPDYQESFAMLYQKPPFSSCEQKS